MKSLSAMCDYQDKVNAGIIAEPCVQRMMMVFGCTMDMSQVVSGLEIGEILIRNIRGYGTVPTRKGGAGCAGGGGELMLM